MKMLSINTGWQLQRIVISDPAKADEAYKILIDAMSKFDKYSNDREKTVSFADDHGEATFRVDQLVAVMIDDLSEAADDAFVQGVLREERIKQKVKQVSSPAVHVREAELQSGHDAPGDHARP